MRLQRFRGLTARFNPWFGCSRVSRACSACYAEAFAKRLGLDVWGKTSDRKFFGDNHWNEPRRWDRKAAKEGHRLRVFCASMADVFEDRPDLDEQRQRLWELVVATPNLDWMLLTKRPQNILGMVPSKWTNLSGWPDHVWAGCTTENQECADERLPYLVKVPAPILFVSAEPLVGALNLKPWIRRLGLVIGGGESGPKAVPTHPTWARSLRDQCLDNRGTPFHWKQWGCWRYFLTPEDGDREPDLWMATDGRTTNKVGALKGGDWQGMFRFSKKSAGRLLDGKVWDQMPVADLCSLWDPTFGV